MPDWDQDFDAYVALIDDALGSFLIDLAAAVHAPLDSHDRRVQVRVALQQPRDDGLRADGEVDALGEFEDRLVELLTERCDAVFVGHLISEGELHVICYAPGDRIEDESRLLEGLDPGGYEVAWFVEDDPKWGMYFGFLFPDAHDFQAIQNRRLLKVFVEHGDDLSRARVIDHTALFEDEGSAQAARAALADQGYAVDDLEHSDSGLWTLQFHREERLDDQRADEFCAELLELLEGFSGNYDGWGAAIVAADA